MESESFAMESGLKLFEVIYGSLKKNALTSQITRKDAEKAASKWLIGARDRGGNRTARTRDKGQNGAITVTVSWFTWTPLPMIPCTPPSSVHITGLYDYTSHNALHLTHLHL